MLSQLSYTPGFPAPHRSASRERGNSPAAPQRQPPRRPPQYRRGERSPAAWQPSRFRQRAEKLGMLAPDRVEHPPALVIGHVGPAQPRRQAQAEALEVLALTLVRLGEHCPARVLLGIGEADGLVTVALTEPGDRVEQPLHVDATDPLAGEQIREAVDAGRQRELRGVSPDGVEQARRTVEQSVIDRLVGQRALEDQLIEQPIERVIPGLARTRDAIDELDTLLVGAERLDDVSLPGRERQ